MPDPSALHDARLDVHRSAGSAVPFVVHSAIAQILLTYVRFSRLPMIVALLVDSNFQQAETNLNEGRMRDRYRPLSIVVGFEDNSVK